MDYKQVERLILLVNTPAKLAVLAKFADAALARVLTLPRDFNEHNNPIWLRYLYLTGIFEGACKRLRQNDIESYYGPYHEELEFFYDRNWYESEYRYRLTFSEKSRKGQGYQY